MAVEVREERGRLQLGRPHALFNAGVSAPVYDQYAVAKDGQRFLVITPAEAADAGIQVVLNWPGLLQ
jgi:hypothetical protein